MARKRNIWDSLVRRIYYKYFSQNILYELQIRARNEAADYVQQFMSDAIIFESQRDIIKFALDNCPEHENYLEFGVATGKSINIIASFLPPESKVFGFDVFDGLPDNWAGHIRAKGMFKQKRLPKVPSNVVLIQGLFEDTLPAFKKNMEGNISFCHVDCDLYASTKTILDIIGDKLVSGSCVLFDEYFNYPAWRQHEWKAWKEFCDNRGLNYQYLGFSANGGSVLIAVL